MMRPTLHNLTLRIFILGLFLKEGGSVITTRHNLLNSLKEYYFFNPEWSYVENGTKQLFSTFDLKNNGSYKTEISVSINANGTNYNIFLQLNTDFLSNSFSSSYIGAGKNGEDIFESYSSKDINNCYYHGYVIGLENSQVVASTCNGLRGTIFLSSDVLQFSPVEEENTHVLYRPHDMPSYSCKTKSFDSFHHTMTANLRTKSSPSRLKRATKEKKFVELLFVADKKEFQYFGSRTKLHDHIKEVVNYIDALYKKLTLRVVLLHVEVWEKEDMITSDLDAQNVLSAFLEYRKERIQTATVSSPWTYTDNAQLLYGGSFDGSTVGMATVSSMCSLRSGGVNEDRGSALHTATTVAHEMGHNLGMSHDTKDCKCDGIKCVMAATSGSTAPDAWSTCSVEYLNNGYKFGTATCLFNAPDSSRLFGGPKCGNGIVESGEKCDCGLPDECQSNCCNATTCQLLPEAQCDDGACCMSDCKFTTSCSKCRPGANDCDITEYCTGFSAHCPGNVHKIDGMDCMSGGGVCYGGVCRTHEMQCQEIWGPDATNGVDNCYLSINKKGDSNGNCGKDGGKFKACTPENALCGKLLCTGGNQYPLVGSDRIFYRNRFQDYVCKTLQSVNDTTDAGAVWDGTKCAEGKMCFNAVCADVSKVLKPCNRDCHGHGICNNFGNCHCEEGWAPPDCSMKGNGGSADSGPICIDGTDMQVILMLVFFLVILPIVLVVISYVWYRYCGGKPKIFAWRKNRARKLNSGVANSAPPNTAIKPTNRGNNFTDIRTEKPTISTPSFIPPRPLPPSRPSPRLPVRPAPARPQIPQKPVSNVAFRKAPEINRPKPTIQQSSIQDKIAQLNRNHVA